LKENYVDSTHPQSQSLLNIYQRVYTAKVAGIVKYIIIYLDTIDPMALDNGWISPLHT